MMSLITSTSASRNLGSATPNVPPTIHAKAIGNRLSTVSRQAATQPPARLDGRITFYVNTNSIFSDGFTNFVVLASAVFVMWRLHKTAND